MSASNATHPDELRASELEPILQLLASYLQQANTGSIPVLPQPDPGAMLQRWKKSRIS